MIDSKKIRVRVAGILRQEDSILLIAHKKDGEVYWLLPGGGVRYGETLTDALKREFMEELNIEIKAFDAVMIFDSISPDGDRHILNICFTVEHTGGEYLLGSDKRLYDYNFFDMQSLGEIPMYPPINDELVKIFNNKNKECYYGSLWTDK